MDLCYANITVEVGKSASSVKKYSEVFWSQAPERLGVSEMDSIIRRVEKGEKKLAEIERLSSRQALSCALAGPLTQLEFRYVGSHGHVHGADRIVIFLYTLIATDMETGLASGQRCDHMSLPF